MLQFVVDAVNHEILLSYVETLLNVNYIHRLKVVWSLVWSRICNITIQLSSTLDALFRSMPVMRWWYKPDVHVLSPMLSIRVRVVVKRETSRWNWLRSHRHLSRAFPFPWMTYEHIKMSPQKTLNSFFLKYFENQIVNFFLPWTQYHQETQANH